MRYEKKVLLSQALRWVNDDIVLFRKKISILSIGYKTMYNGIKRN